MGKAKKGRYQIIAARTAPKIGLSTLPNVLDVSITPRPVFTSFSLLHISPPNGGTIGEPPAAPTPCKNRPIKMTQYALSNNQEASPAINPPIPATIRLGTI